MSRDMRDAHETARARDAKAKADARHARFMAAIDRILARDPQTTQPRDAAWMLGALDGTGGPRTRTHHIDTETGQFTLLDNQEDTMDAPNEVKIHVTIDHEQVSEAARLAAELFITEYASRLVEAVDPSYLDDEPVEDCGCPPRVHVNPERTDWLDEPIPVPRPEAAPEFKAPFISDVRRAPAPADVDPDEALAKVLLAHIAGTRGMTWDNTGLRGEYRAAARAAREHIEAEADDADFSAASLHYARAERAEADLARMTKARDRHSRAADKWCNLYADKCEEIESVQAKADRYDALRADVWVESGSRVAAAAAAAHGILARDTERAAKGAQS